MKSLEETIAQKCKFLGNSKKDYELYSLVPHNSSPYIVRLFLSNPGIESKTIITLLKEILPLFVDICSCLKHNGCFSDIIMSLKFNFILSKLIYKDFIDLSGELLDNPVNKINSIIALITNRGYYNAFGTPFRLEILLSFNQGMRYLEHYDSLPNHKGY